MVPARAELRILDLPTMKITHSITIPKDLLVLKHPSAPAELAEP